MYRNVSHWRWLNCSVMSKLGISLLLRPLCFFILLFAMPYSCRTSYSKDIPLPGRFFHLCGWQSQNKSSQKVCQAGPPLTLAQGRKFRGISVETNPSSSATSFFPRFAPTYAREFAWGVICPWQPATTVYGIQKENLRECRWEGEVWLSDAIHQDQ